MLIKINKNKMTKAVTILAENKINFSVVEEKKEGLNIPLEFTDFIEDYPYKTKRTAIYIYYVMLDIYMNWGCKYKTIQSYSSFYSKQTGLSRATLAPIYEILEHGGFITRGTIDVQGKNWSYSTLTFNPKGIK